MTLAQERLDPAGGERLQGLLKAGDPYGEVRLAWHAKETLRDVYQIRDPGLADEYTRRLAAGLQDQSCPPEVNQLGRAIARWYTQNCCPASAPGCRTDPPKRLTISPERIKRIGFGFRNFTNYRIRALLYAGKPNWDLLPSVTLPLKSEEPVWMPSRRRGLRFGPLGFIPRPKGGVHGTTGRG